MIAGLHVRDDRGSGAVLVTKIGWPTPPPVGAEWSCCRHPDIPLARVTSVEWAGLDGDPDAWVAMAGEPRLINHLIDRHAFVPHQR